MKNNNKKVKTLATVAGIAAAGSAAQASVIYHDITDLTVDDAERLLLDIEGGTAVNTTETPTGTEIDFQIGFGPSSIREKPEFIGLNGAYVAMDSVNTTWTMKLDSSDTIDGSLLFGEYGFIEVNDNGNWEGGATDKFLGFQLNQGTPEKMFGWVRMDYDDVGNSITVKDFAYDTSGAALSSGSVIPEPSIAALVLLAGSALLGLNRFRKQNNPS